jgi:hypothetical protein
MTGELTTINVSAEDQLAELKGMLGIDPYSSFGDASNRIVKLRSELAGLYQAVGLLRQANDRLTQQGQQATVLFEQMKAKIDDLTRQLEGGQDEAKVNDAIH